ncbi:MAG: type II secretion system protein GspG [Agriterribacter sp.]
MSDTTSIKPKFPYLVGLICIIPLIGAFVGLVLLILGLTKYRDKWLVIIGVAGIIWTILIYSFLFFAIKNAKVFKEGFSTISQMQLDRLVKDIEFYKLQHGQYPDKLSQLLNDDPQSQIYDPIELNQMRKNREYNYEKIGDKYVLFSSGQDGIPNTKDDLFPKIIINDSSKIGLIENK